MNNSKRNYIHMKYFALFATVIGFFLPITAAAQELDKSLLPKIHSFKIIHEITDEAKESKINWIEFSWETDGADRVQLYKEGVEIKSRSQRPNGDIGWPLSMAGGFKSQYKRPTMYELVAENGKGKVSEQLNVTMEKKEIPPIALRPEIIDFRVEPKNINSGDQVSFYWQVKNAYQVRLYDSFGEIKSRIQLPKGNYGWPLSMNGEYSENLNKSETYMLVLTGKNDTVTKNAKVYVTNKKCKLIISVTGIYNKHTDGIGIYKVTSNGINKFLFKSPVNAINKQGQISYWSTIKLPSGNYYLAPYGGGKDKHGNFGVMYKPRNIYYNCIDGKTKYITIKADFAEY
jgi:hypothetical protein